MTKERLYQESDEDYKAMLDIFFESNVCISKGQLDANTDILHHTENVGPWEPSLGEWVVSKVNNENFQVHRYNPYFNSPTDVEPFIGTLPSFIDEM